MVDLALRMLLHDRMRFLITVAGVAFAVQLILSQVGLFLGLVRNSSVIVRHIPADIWVTSRNTPNVDFAQTFPETYVNRVRSIPGVARADNLIVTFVNATLPTGATEGTVTYALEDFRAWNLPWDMESGSVEDLRRGNYIVTDASAARRIGAFAAGDYRQVQGVRMRYAGRSRGAVSFTTTPVSFMDYRLVQQLNPDLLSGSTTYILVKAAPGADLKALRAEIGRRLPHNDVYTARDWADRSDAYWINNTGIGMNAFTAVFLGVLVGVVVVAQTLYTSTMDHLKEFGTVKAIGGSNADIYLLLGRQAAVAAVLGFTLGGLMVLGLRPAVAALGLQLILPMRVWALVGGGTLLMCVLSAGLSFRKVAGIDPGLVFRS
ncbi:ABC transporter permease [Geothrix sp. 21YS21S-2]|uniref:ABC transporter permease n=1 Tax=Geothrix sp. 21YS21S-2 TaxID=3068893 RepID=UPI0027BAE9D0|nr:ABC transporter permease [Geothrix sp. 21YS21S-2]